jgi:subfamily B ATP-binding cassette protein MsbA
MAIDSKKLSYLEKLYALRRIAWYRPMFTAGLIVLGAFVAFLEGIGLGFIYPIIETAQAEEPTNVSGPVIEVFISAYQILNIPFSLGYLIIGVALVMTVRYTMSFLVGWLAAVLSKQYEKTLRTRAFNHALDAKISYFDQKGTDDILNAIITETRYSGRVIRQGITLLKSLFLILIYVSVMFYIAPSMTLLAIVLLGSITAILRFMIEPAANIGTRVAESNERVQETVQAGTQGIRDVKLFGLRSGVFSAFSDAINKYAHSEIKLKRNKVAIQNFFELSAAIIIFALIYVGFAFTDLSLGEIGIFLIAMFQLAPKMSVVNSNIYNVEGNLSHAVRTHDFIDEIKNGRESSGSKTVSSISSIEFDNVGFSYDEDEEVLCGISFSVTKKEFIAFVGESGAGKSTIVSLLSRMYDPNSGIIRADNTNIEEYDVDEWRERIAVVRQQPFIFTDTLENNVTVGNRDATRREIERICKIARVNEFVDELPNGYESQLGDDGVRLSGGQRQRVALARALLKDADFLVLDEATSDLDSNLEQQVQTAIEEIDHEYGIVVIAHRLSTVKNADRIYTLEDGEIIEEGTHDELLSNEGEYAELYGIQSQA